MPKKAERYTNDILDRPGMVFAVDLKDPKERVQAYLDSYKNDPETTTVCSVLSFITFLFYKSYYV